MNNLMAIIDYFRDLKSKHGRSLSWKIHWRCLLPASVQLIQLPNNVHIVFCVLFGTCWLIEELNFITPRILSESLQPGWNTKSGRQPSLIWGLWCVGVHAISTYGWVESKKTITVFYHSIPAWYFLYITIAGNKWWKSKRWKVEKKTWWCGWKG